MNSSNSLYPKSAEHVRKGAIFVPNFASCALKTSRPSVQNVSFVVARKRGLAVRVSGKEWAQGRGVAIMEAPLRDPGRPKEKRGSAMLKKRDGSVGAKLEDSLGTFSFKSFPFLIWQTNHCKKSQGE